MERTMMQSTEDTVEEMKSVPLDPDPKDSNPNSGSDPNPKHVVGALSISNGPEVNAAAGGKELDSKPKDAAVVDSELADGSKNKKSVRWSQELVMETQIPRESDRETGNPYVNYSPASSENRSSFNFKDTMDTVKDVLGRWGKRMGEATKKAEDFAGNTWQHLKTSPSLTDAALGRIAQGTKVIAEGGYEKIFQQTFETVAEEKLVNSFACYLSTSAGPVIGVLYVSTSKLAFCSDNPLSYQAGDKTEWSYYKVVVPLHQLKAVNPSTSTTNPAEKYIQVISIDNHEFWYMGFLNYNGAVECLRNSLLPPSDQSV